MAVTTNKKKTYKYVPLFALFIIEAVGYKC